MNIAATSKPFVGTYTALDTFRRVCEHQAYRRYVKKDIPFERTPAMEFGTKVHEAFAARCKSKTPLPEEFQKWEGFAHPFDQYKVITERKLGMTADAKATGYFADDVWFRGQADLSVFQNDKVLLIDWKTGSSKYEDDFELRTNALLVALHFPNVQHIVGAYAWLKENRMSNFYDCSNVKETFWEIRELMQQITGRMHFEKRKSGLCGYCPVEDCEHWYEAKK